MSKLPGRSPGAAFEAVTKRMSGDLGSTLRLLADHGEVGLVWADDDLIVRARHGELGQDAIVGAPLCDCVIALFGQGDAIKRLRDDPKPLVIGNVSIIGRDGTSRARLTYTVLRDPSVPGFVVSIRPASADADLALDLEQSLRREYQLKSEKAAQAAAVAEANAALRRANDDLVDFTRIVSHDLKAPLRAIRYSADAIENAIAAPEEVSASDADAALAQLRRQTQRLSAMITDLLAYARLEHKEDAVARVSTRGLIDDIVIGLPRPAGMFIDVRGVWPEINTIGPLLDLVLRNIVDNAVKHHDRDTGRIEIVCALDGDHLAIRITDDGPGIPSRYHEAVFDPFVRLDPERSAGSGMGLAMVRQAAERAGAMLSLSSDPPAARSSSLLLRWPLTFGPK